MKKFSLIMPVYKSEQYLARAIKSIQDQRDYPNWELIVVCDGKSEEAEKILKEFESDKRISLISIEHKGAPAARNAGAKLATGDFLSFFSSDFIAYPGMLREWEDAFEQRPEAGFIYSGYDLLEEGQYVGHLPSQPFDARQLETMNYIDGGFPLRREVYIPWDESIKSLQDWDFWLAIVKSGVKGYYLDSRVYAAEVPKQGGLSHDSSANWLERVETIKIKHNIPQRDVCVCSLGAPFHAKKLANLIGADFQIMPSFKPHKYRLIYLLGFYATNADHIKVFEGSGKDDKVVKAIHWIGSDVFILDSMKHNELRTLANSFLNNVIDYNIAEYDFTQIELDDFGVKGKSTPKVPILALPTELDNEQYPLPEKFTIAVYAPPSADGRWKYQLNLMRDLVKALPDIDFVFFGGNGTSEMYNLKYLDWRPTNEIIKMSSMLLRFTVHDGLPASAVEFLMKGRQVLTNTPMPYVEWFTTRTENAMCGITKKDLPDIKNKLIDRIRDLQKGYGSLTYNWNEIQTYYKSACSVERFKAQIDKMLNREPLENLPTVDKYYINGSLLNGGKNV